MIQQTTRLIELPLSHIVIERRLRREMGDLDALSDSIRSIGLLQPIVVTPTGRLIAGERRLEACRLLGMQTIMCCVAESLEEAYAPMLAEIQENTCRKSFSPSEAVSAAQDLEPMAKAAAWRRKIHEEWGAPEKFSEGGRYMDHIAKIVDMSRPTLEKAIKVVEAARESPDKYQDLVEKMDRTGKVNGAYMTMLQRQGEAPFRAAPAYLSIRMDRGGNCKITGLRDKAEIIANLKALIRQIEDGLSEES
jgi:ParB family chromosome partitioning protein